MFRHLPILRIGCFFLSVQQGKDTPRSGSGRAKTARHTGYGGERLGKLLGILQHRLHITDPHIAVQDGQAAKHSTQNIAQIVYQVGNGIDFARGAFGVPGGFGQPGIEPVKILFCLILMIIGLYQ